MWTRIAVALVLVGCGRVGYDDFPTDAAGDTTAAARLVEYPLDIGGSIARDRVAPVLDVPITPVTGSPSFAVGQGGGGHLSFSAPDGSDPGSARVDIVGTKLDVVHLSTAASIEIKYVFDDCNHATFQGESRVAGIGDGDSGPENGWFAARVYRQVDGLSVKFEGNADWSRYVRQGLDCVVGVPRVAHYVVESSCPDPVRMYLDGVAVVVSGDPFPASGQRIDLGGGARRLYIGSPHTGFRSARLRVYYIAFYDRALTDSEIVARSATLAADDD